jgi:hypothetical protein
VLEDLELETPPVVIRLLLLAATHWLAAVEKEDRRVVLVELVQVETTTIRVVLVDLVLMKVPIRTLAEEVLRDRTEMAEQVLLEQQRQPPVKRGLLDGV